jgi:hypothetical protein
MLDGMRMFSDWIFQQIWCRRHRNGLPEAPISNLLLRMLLFGRTRPSFPDLYVSRHGVMFFDDPVAAFANLATSAAENAQMVLSCFRAPSENAWATKIASLVPSAPSGDPHAPGPFAFADPERVKGIHSEAGWTDVGFEAVDFDYVAGSGEDPVADALDFFGHIGPAARAIRMLEGDARIAFLGRLGELAEAHLHDGAVRFAASAWIVTARKN